MSHLVPIFTKKKVILTKINLSTKSLVQFCYAKNEIKRNIELRLERRIVLHTFLGFGDQISAAKIIENYLNFGVEVFLPVKKENILQLNKFYGDWNGLKLFEVSSNNKMSTQEVKEFSVKNKTQIAKVSNNTYETIANCYPEYFINSHFNIAFGINPLQLISTKLRESINKITQIDVPDRSFAYIDHHPGTERSIPKKVLEMLERRDILVVQNPRNEPLASTLALMDSAAELHLVNSAPLCMALTLDARSLKKIHYDSRNDPATKSYSNWESVTILTNQPREGAAQLLRMRQNAKVISILKNKLESTLKIGKFEERVN